MKECRGQGYDGTAAMSSEGVGVQAEIRPQRNGFLSAVIKDQYPENVRTKPLITLCTTRWARNGAATLIR